MKLIAWAVTVLVLLAGSAWAQPKAGRDDAATVKALEEKWAAAASRNDPAGVALILAEDFVVTGADGKTNTKAGLLAWMKDRKYASNRVEDIKVNVYGDAAVATGIYRGKGTENGKPFDEVERWTDTFIRIGGQWKCVASHSSSMKTAN